MKNEIAPDPVMSSPALRARATAEITLMAAGQPLKKIQLDQRLYTDTLSDVYAVLRDFGGRARRLMLVGHNPWMDDLLTELSQDLPPETDGDWIIKTNTLVRLAMPEDWADLPPGCASILDMVYPRSLAD